LAWTVWAPKGTTFVKGVNAVLNIVYSFIGHPLIPSYIGDMRDPSQFPKALYITMAIEIALFTVLGAFVYHRTGESEYSHRANSID
jgi:amino acid permease